MRGTGPPKPRPGLVPKLVAEVQGKRSCSETAISSENKKAKPAVDHVADLQTQLAKVSKERMDIEKERDENDEMVTTLKQELEKVREEKAVKVKEVAMGLRSKCERLVMENNDLMQRVQVLERENVILMNNSVQEHFTEFLKKEEGIVNVDQFMLENYQMAIPEEVVKEVEAAHQERNEKRAKQSEYVQLEDLAFKSTNAFHKLTKQIVELKKETSHLKEEAVKNKEEALKKEESHKTAIESFLIMQPT